MQSSCTVEIDKPIEAVFDYTNKNVAEWSSCVVEDVMIEEKNDGGLGTKFRTVTEERGRRMEFPVEVTHYEPLTASTVVLVGDSFILRRRTHLNRWTKAARA